MEAAAWTNHALGGRKTAGGDGNLRQGLKMEEGKEA
jgi:hypothetical protein